MQGNIKKIRRHTSHYKNTLFTSMLVLVPVLIVSVVNFFILYTINMKNIQNDLRMESERALEVLNTQLNSMSKIVSMKRMDRTFSTEAQTKLGTVYYPIVQQLRKDAMWTPFFSDIGYYNVQSERVYRMNSASSSEEYFGTKKNKTVYYENNKLEMQPWDEQSLREEGNYTRAIRIRNAEQNSDGILFAVPLELRKDAPPLSYMLFTISDDMLFNIINADESTICVLQYLGIPVYSSDPEICKLFYFGEGMPDIFFSSDTLTFSKYGLQVSWKISREFQMQKLVPTIILEAAVTFLVMVIGLLLLLYISRKNYEPVQNLLRKLPPCSDSEPLTDEFKYINFVLDDLTYSKRFYEESIQELRREKFLFYILDNQVEPGKMLYRQCLHEGIRVDRKYFACILMEDSEKNYNLFEWLMSEEKNTEKKADMYSLYIMENKYLFLLASDMPIPEFELYLSGLAGDNPELVKVSNVIEGIRYVRKAYTSVCWPEQKMEAEENVSQYPLIELQLLEEAVETNNIDKVEFALRMIKNDMSGFNEALRKKVLKKVYRLISNGEDATISGDTDYKLFSCEEGEYVQILDEWLAKFTNVNSKIIPVKKTLPRNLHTIMHYIEENYTNPEFSIKYMAAVFGTSPSNLSHQFKKLTGETLSRFIDELRISKAEELLNAGEKIHVIAQKLGYSTTPVFTETYKRIRGITPSMYRNSYQRKMNEEE